MQVLSAYQTASLTMIDADGARVASNTSLGRTHDETDSSSPWTTWGAESIIKVNMAAPTATTASAGVS